MGRYLLRRLAYLIPVWLGISFVAFALANLTPGDPARLMLQRDLGRQPTGEEVAIAREALGLNDAYLVRYGRWLGGAVTGDLGASYRTGEPVFGALLARFPNTFQIAVLGLLGALLIALPLGVLGAVWRNSPIDHLARVLALVGAAMPSYWVAYLLILVFAVRLQLLPVAGRGTWQHYVLPSVTLGLAASARFVQADLYAARTAIAEPQAFDLVFVTWGAIGWLPDLAEWARIVAWFLKPGGSLVLQGYTPRQLEYRTGGPPFVSHLYTPALLREAFAGLEIVELREYEADLAEGKGHCGRSALVGLVARKP